MCVVFLFAVTQGWEPERRGNRMISFFWSRHASARGHEPYYVWMTYVLLRERGWSGGARSRLLATVGLQSASGGCASTLTQEWKLFGRGASLLSSLLTCRSHHTH